VSDKPWPPARQAAANASAQRGCRGRGAVEAELTFDPLLDAVNITVRNMDGQVALNGTVPNYPQYQEATAAAQRVAGVTNVHNHLEVVLPPGNYRDDPMLAAAANNALALNTSRFSSRTPSTATRWSWMTAT
jgi:hypothetical protein